MTGNQVPTRGIHSRFSRATNRRDKTVAHECNFVTHRPSERSERLSRKKELPATKYVDQFSQVELSTDAEDGSSRMSHFPGWCERNEQVNLFLQFSWES